MIKKRNLLILAGVVVLLAAVMLVILNLPEEKEEADTAPVATTAPAVTVYQCDAEQITEIAAATPEEQFAFVRQDGAWGVKGEPNIRLKGSSVDSLASKFSEFTAKQEVAAEAADLAPYGLDQPQAAYTVALTDGSQTVFQLGNEDTVNSVYFLKLAAAPNIYAISSGTASTLLRGLKEYRDDTLMTVSAEKLNRVVIERSDETIELQKTEAQDEATGGEVWNMVRPRQKETDSQRVSEEILTPLSSLAIEDYVYDRADRDAEFGLSVPAAVIRLSDSDGKSQNIYVGSKSDSSYYIRTDGSDSIYLAPADSLPMVNVTAFTLIQKFVSLENIDTVDSIDVQTSDASYTMRIQREETAQATPASEGEEGGSAEEPSASYFLNGAEVEESRFKSDLYQKVIGLTADGFSSGAQRSGIRATVVYHFLDGTSKSFDYCDYDERNYAVFDQSGTSEYVIKKKKVDDMLDSIRAVASGE